MRKLGKSFGDQISVGRSTPGIGIPRKYLGWGVRLSLFYILLFGSFFLLLIRLFHVTVIKGAYYRTLSDENRIRERIIHAPRGSILDRYGEALVRNVPAFRLRTPCNKNVEKECVTFLNHEEVLKKESTGGFDAGQLETDAKREYTYPETFAHTLGYLSEITQSELDMPSFTYQGYALGDRIGREGIEQNWEKELRGSDGKELIEVDAAGKQMRILGKQEEIPGNNVTTSLDRALQEVAFAALEDRAGAVVVLKPQTGEVLALVSSPSYNPNELNNGLTQGEYEALLNHSDTPLFNRAISGLYPPASTFKLVTAAGALEEQAITRETTVEDMGILRVGAFSFANWYFTQYGKTEGMVDMVRALARSNDIFFYKTGEVLGIEKMAQWGKRLGFGSITGITLSGEAAGVMPDPVWRESTRGEKWYLGDTYHVAIGQGDIEATPLQVGVMTNVFASEGMWCAPTLEKSQNTKLNDQKNCKDLKISKKTLDLVKEGMRQACSTGGTGWPFFEFDPAVACKTGTAEFGDPDNKTHAWFTAFAPVEDPEIVVTVLVEQGGEGSSVAGPVAKKVLEEWFGR